MKKRYLDNKKRLCELSYDILYETSNTFKRCLRVDHIPPTRDFGETLKMHQY